jgi:antitoxin VapB
MALYIKDPEVDRLAREVASLEHSSITEAVKGVLAKRRSEILAERGDRDRRIRERLERIWAMPVLDDRTPDEMLYDRDGLPK